MKTQSQLLREWQKNSNKPTCYGEMLRFMKMERLAAIERVKGCKNRVKSEYRGSASFFTCNLNPRIGKCLACQYLIAYYKLKEGEL